MKTTAKWLSEMVPTGLAPRELASLLTNVGHEVEAVQELPGGDTMFRLEITSNRTDCLGVLGLAREVSARTGKPVVWKLPELPPASGDPGVAVTIDGAAATKCPFYSAQIIRGVKVGSSPEWLRERLAAVGCASVNNIVDITNYVMFELSQPLHAFDLARVGGRKINVRLAAPGEVFNAINHRAYKLSADDLVIADAQRAVALAGVMGGADSEISVSTTDVLLESAYFEPQGVKATGRRCDPQHSDSLASESRHRFERGVDSAGALAASRRAATLIIELAGGTLVGAPVCAGTEPPHWVGEVTLRGASVARTLGDSVPADTCAAILTGLGLKLTASTGEAQTFRIPSFRRDLVAEIDLIEEIARVHGLEKFAPRLTIPVARSRREPEDEARERIRSLLLSTGFDEVITDTFVSATGASAHTPWPSDAPLEARVAINANWPCLRRSVIPSLVRVWANNTRHGSNDVRLFEQAGVTLTKGGTARELNVVGCIGPNYFAVKGALEGLFARLGLPSVTVAPHDFALFAPGRGAAVHCNGKLLAVLGEVSDEVMREFDLAHRCGVAEIDVAAVIALRTVTPRFAPLPRFPEVTRDLAVVLDESVTWESIGARAKAHGGRHLRDVRFFDEFRGKQIPAGKKSVAFSLMFRDDERTLVGAVVDASVAAVVEALKTGLGAVLRA
jgi:phenylalanyl-tRNA synthetase beta chain